MTNKEAECRIDVCVAGIEFRMRRLFDEQNRVDDGVLWWSVAGKLAEVETLAAEANRLAVGLVSECRESL